MNNSQLAGSPLEKWGGNYKNLVIHRIEEAENSEMADNSGTYDGRIAQNQYSLFRPQRL